MSMVFWLLQSLGMCQRKVKFICSGTLKLGLNLSSPKVIGTIFITRFGQGVTFRNRLWTPENQVNRRHSINCAFEPLTFYLLLHWFSILGHHPVFPHLFGRVRVTACPGLPGTALILKTCASRKPSSTQANPESWSLEAESGDKRFFVLLDQ